MTMLATAFRMLVDSSRMMDRFFIKIPAAQWKAIEKEPPYRHTPPRQLHRDWLFSASEMG